MSEHTTGPWKVHQQGNVILDVNGTFVIDLNGVLLADARLIAATPDLLEAAELALHVYQKGKLKGTGDAFGPVADKLIAAIQKATGGNDV